MKLEPRYKKIFKKMQEQGKANAVCSKDPLQSKKYINSALKIKQDYNKLERGSWNYIIKLESTTCEN